MPIVFGRLRRRRDEPAASPPIETMLPDGQPMPSIFERKPTRKPDLIVPDELVPQLWFVRDPDGRVFTDRLRFLRDGRLAASPDPDICRWTLDDGELRLLTADGGVAHAFRSSVRSSGLPTLSTEPAPSTREAEDDETDGSSPDGGAEPAPDQAPEAPAIGLRLAPNHGDLTVRARLDGGSRVLLVGFAQPFDQALSGASEADALDAWHDPSTLEASHVVLAECLTPAYCYLNKTGRIVALLRAMVLPGTERVVLAGSSAGGFACMLFAELLSAALPDTEIVSLVVNPPAGYGTDAEAFARDHVPERDRHPAPDADALEQRDTWFANIPKTRETLRRKQGNFRHVVLYDAGNAGVSRLADLIGAFDNVELRPFELGRSHQAGALAIIATGEPRRALELLLDPDRSQLPARAREPDPPPEPD